MASLYNSISKDYQPSRGMLIFVFLLGALLYANTFNHGYLLDDLLVIKKNRITQQGINGIPTILTSAYRFGYGNGKRKIGLYRPLSVVTFALEFEFFGLNNMVYHINNILLYALTGVVLFLTLLKLFRHYKVLFSLAVTVLFIAHPIHTEVVANLKSRDEILGFLFILTSLLYLLKYFEQNKPLHLIISLFAYCLSLLSKESAVTHLAILPVVYYFFVAGTVRKKTLVWISFAGIVGIYLYVRFLIVPGIEGGDSMPVIQNSLLAAQSANERWATVISIMGHAIRLLVFPHPLIYDYSYNHLPIVNWADFKAILSAVFILSALGYACFKFSKKDPIAFGVLFYCISISLTSNVILIIAWTFGERFLYVPSLGFCIILTVLLFKLCKIDLEKEKIASWPKFTFTGLVVLIVSIYSIKTISRNSDWKDNLTLFEVDSKIASNSARVHAHFGSELNAHADKERSEVKRRDLYNKAFNQFHMALSIYPDYDKVYNELGIIYHKTGKYHLALKNFEHVIENFPNYRDSYHNMGLVYTDLKQFDKALEYYLKAVEIDSNYHKSHINAANSYYELGDIDNAISHSVKAREVDPDNPNINDNLAILYQAKGKQLVQLAKEEQVKEIKDQIISQALGYLNETLRVFPQSKSTYNELGNAYFELGGYSSAIENYKTALVIDTSFIEPYHNLAFTYQVLEQYNVAIALFKRVFKLDSTYVRAHVNISSAYHAIKDYEKAIFHSYKALKFDPDLYRVYYNLSVFYRELGDEATAESMTKKGEDLYRKLQEKERMLTQGVN